MLLLISSLANHSLAWAWFLWSKVLLWWIIFLIDWYHKPLKNTVDPLLFYRELFYGFSWKGLWKHQKKKHSFHNKHTYIYRPQTFWSFMNFYFVHTYCKDLFCLWKNSHYAYILLYLHKTLPTLENEKEQWQIRFSKKLLGKLIFLRVTKNFKMFYFTHTTAWVLKK